MQDVRINAIENERHKLRRKQSLVITTSWQGEYGRSLSFLGRLPAVVPEYPESWSPACAPGCCFKGKCHFMLTTTRVCLDLLEANVAKVGVRDVSDKDPPDLEDSLPFVGRPHSAASRVVNLKGGTIMRESWGWGVWYPPASTSPPSRRSDHCRDCSVWSRGGSTIYGY